MSWWQRGRKKSTGAPARRSGAVVVMTVMIATLTWPTEVLAELEPETHIDSLYPTANTTWRCINGVSGGDTPTNGFCRTDNADTSYYTDSDNSNGSGDIRNPGTFTVVIEREYDDKTALNMRFQPDPKFSGSGETDIIYNQGALVPNVLGRAWCNDAVEGTNECDQHYARFASHTPHSRVICHETGHTVGLTHGAQANPAQSNSTIGMWCMRTPLGTDVDAVIGPSLVSQLDEHYQNQ